MAWEPGFWAKSGGSCFLGMRCWSYCQARAGGCPHSGEERAKQHPMAFSIRNPAIKARQGTRCPGKTDANLVPPCTKNSSRCHPVPLSARAQLAPSHQAQIHLLLLSFQGTSLIWKSTFHPKTSAAMGPPSPTPNCRQTRGGNPQTEAGETLLGQEPAEHGVCGAALQPLPPGGVSHGQDKAQRGWSKGPDLSQR